MQGKLRWTHHDFHLCNFEVYKRFQLKTHSVPTSVLDICIINAAMCDSLQAKGP